MIEARSRRGVFLFGRQLLFLSENDSERVFLALGHESLLLCHFGELAFGLQQILESSAFYDSTVVEDNDFVHVGQGGEAMGDADDRPAFFERVDGGLDLFFRSGIQSGSWLVENQDRSVTDKSPGN